MPLGISYGLRSNYFWVVKKAWRDSLRDATAARRLHNRITELEPNNVDARLVQGLHDYIVGSLPWSYRDARLPGRAFHGDKEKGIHTVAGRGPQRPTQPRGRGDLSVRPLPPRKPAATAVPLLQDLIARFPRNYLLRLELSQMYSMAGDGTRALATVDEVARQKTGHAPGFDRLPWEKIYFQEGTIQFWYNDLDHALENLKKVAASAEELDLNTGAQTWLRIGPDLRHDPSPGGGHRGLPESHRLRAAGRRGPGIAQVPRRAL